MPYLSIIVPVYNVEQYLDECLSSIINQTYTDWECICVNDGSTDKSCQILERYAEQDSRIRLISQENKGLAATRSEGMLWAKGKFIIFVDSDDYLDTNACEQLVLIAETHNMDVLGYSYKTYPNGCSSKYSMQTEKLLSPSRLLGSTSVPQSSDDMCFVWRYMIRRELLTEFNIHFNSKVRFAEDMIFVMEVFSYARNVYLTDFAPYNYRTNNPHSIMHESKYNPYMEESLQLVYDIKRQIIKRNNWDELTPFSLDLADRAVKRYSRMLMANRKAKGEGKEQYIREVLSLPMMKDAMKVIGFRNIFDNWKEYMVFLCMKFQFMPVLKRYF